MDRYNGSNVSDSRLRPILRTLSRGLRRLIEDLHPRNELPPFVFSDPIRPCDRKHHIILRPNSKELRHLTRQTEPTLNALHFSVEDH
jgi:hypothetical protein